LKTSWEAGHVKALLLELARQLAKFSFALFFGRLVGGWSGLTAAPAACCSF